MKKITILLAILLVSIGVNAQNITKANASVTAPTVQKFYGARGDTLIKNNTLIQVFEVAPYCTSAKFRLNVTKISGTSLKVRAIMQSSLDGVTYVAKDTVTVTGTTTGTGLSDLVTMTDRYVKFIISPIDTTQKVRPTMYLLLNNR
jgi:hypothetical protein